MVGLRVIHTSLCLERRLSFLGRVVPRLPTAPQTSSSPPHTTTTPFSPQGESLVSGMVPGSAMAFKADKSALDRPELLCFPSKSEAMFVPDSLIFRSARARNCTHTHTHTLAQAHMRTHTRTSTCAHAHTHIFRTVPTLSGRGTLTSYCV